MKVGKVVVRYLCVLKLHEVSLNSNEKQDVFLMTHLTDGPSFEARRIQPSTNECSWFFFQKKLLQSNF